MTRLFLIVALVLGSGVALAANEKPERIGQTYPIREPDMLEEIMSRLKKKEQSGELERIQRAAADRAKVKVLNPKPVPGISKARQKRVFYYDPTVLVQQDIVAPDGRILVPRGTRANPLDSQDFGEPMFFFDARDSKQVSQALAIDKFYKGAVMHVLTGGSFVELMKKWKRKVFYDQSGFITKKIGITRVPALVTQEGNRLRIEEFAP